MYRSMLPSFHRSIVPSAVGLLGALACAGGTGGIGGGPTPAVRADTTALPPAGYGTLRQEDVAIRLRAGPLDIRVIPLDERVLRLLAPDTYASLHRLREDRRDEIRAVQERAGVTGPTLFIVTFFGLQELARFEPELLTITAQNRVFRPIASLPLSPLWSGRQLGQRETATAIYLFGDGIRVLDPFAVSYENVTNRRWEDILRTLDRERASVFARAAQR